ncbi:hypothetical protein B0I35DRAFT_409746 [Stachybotrys elegans]|uniref:Uncharacterized protein n=1 Tax=Stachybotrys elegans TaxID=80388 RepID=A0A8K0SPR4_9HYPO|nr:hypothetical protein B0I35DRAFT_409746 [Stachybotrys elegans]
MHLFKIALALLPALALAQEEDTTTTLTSTTVLTKTYYLSEVHTVTSTYDNSTASVTPTVGTTSHFTSLSPTITSGTGGEASESTNGPDPDSAASALDSGKVILAGIAGMVAVAML